MVGPVVKFFESSIDCQINYQLLIEECVRLWPSGIRYDKVQMVISDAAFYMKKAFKQTVFPDMYHIICLAHAIHNLCEHIRDNYSHVNNLVPIIKSSLKNCGSRQVQFIEKIGYLPTKPVITRWRTFLETVEFDIHHWNDIHEWINVIELADEAVNCLVNGSRNWKHKV